MQVKCVNNNIKLCFFILAEMMINYKKQTMITEVKSEKHYSICIMLLNDCKNFFII